MVDNDLLCNYKNCKKRLLDVAWVTSCSHTFCQQDADRVFSQTLVCPACEHKLEGNHHIVRQNLKPTEQWKSIVLAGLRPEIVMEIASRAMTYWMYQSHQQLVRATWLITKIKESRDKMESNYEAVLNKLQAEVKSAKIDVRAKTEDLNATRKKLAELAEDNAAKTRQNQRLQILHDTLRRKSNDFLAMEEDPPANQQGENRVESREQFQRDHQIHLQLGSDIFGSVWNNSTTNSKGNQQHAQDQLLFKPTVANSTTPPETSRNDFVLNPFPTPVYEPMDQS